MERPVTVYKYVVQQFCGKAGVDVFAGAEQLRRRLAAV